MNLFKTGPYNYFEIELVNKLQNMFSKSKIILNFQLKILSWGKFYQK